MGGQDNHDRVNLFIRGMAEDEQNTSNLGGHNPKILSDDENGDYSRYDSAQQYGFTDGDYAEGDDHDKFSKINQVNFDIKTDTDVESRIQFEKYCTSQIPNIDDSDTMFDNGDDDEDWPNNSGEENSNIFENSNIDNGRTRCKSTGSNEGDEVAATPNVGDRGDETFDVDDKMDATSTATTSDTTTAATQETESPEHQTTPHPTETPWFGQEDENSKTEEKPAEG